MTGKRNAYITLTDNTNPGAVQTNDEGVIEYSGATPVTASVWAEMKYLDGARAVHYGMADQVNPAWFKILKDDAPFVQSSTGLEYEGQQFKIHSVVQEQNPPITLKIIAYQERN